MTNDPFKLTTQGIDLLNRAANHIQAHPEEFDMGDWECGTKACIAGHVGRLISAPLSRIGIGIFEESKYKILQTLFEDPPEYLCDVPLFEDFGKDYALRDLSEDSHADCVTAIHRFVAAHSTAKDP